MGVTLAERLQFVNNKMAELGYDAEVFVIESEGLFKAQLVKRNDGRWITNLSEYIAEGQMMGLLSAYYQGMALKNDLERENKVRKMASPPTPLPHPDWSAVISNCISHVVESWKDGWLPDDDYPHYIYEAALEAVYGKDIFAKLNKRTR